MNPESIGSKADKLEKNPTEGQQLVEDTRGKVIARGAGLRIVRPEPRKDRIRQGV